MRKLFLLVLLLGLYACTEMQSDGFTLELNPGIDTINVNETFVDAGASAKYLGVSIGVKVISDSVNPEVLGTYEIIYEAKYASKTLRVTRFVQVVDDIPPTISLNPGVDTIKKGTPWIDSGVTVFDNALQDVDVLVLGEVNTSMTGEYIITYIATDSSDNTSEIRRYVNVIE